MVVEWLTILMVHISKVFNKLIVTQQFKVVHGVLC